MQTIPSLMTAEQLLNNWKEYFVCPFSKNTEAMTETLNTRINTGRDNQGVVRSSLICANCKEFYHESWMSNQVLSETIRECFNKKKSFECPRCLAISKTMPITKHLEKSSPIETVRVEHMLTFAEYHVLQEQFNTYKKKIRDLEETLEDQKA